MFILACSLVAMISGLVVRPAMQGDSTASRAAVGDFDGDGFPDIALAMPRPAFDAGTPDDESVYESLMLFRGSFDGLKPWSGSSENLQAWQIDGLAAGDFDGDGLQDLACVGLPVVGAETERRGLGIRVARGSQEGLTGWTSPPHPRKGPQLDEVLSFQAIESGDLNGDGRDDLVIAVHAASDDENPILAITFKGSKNGLVPWGPVHSFDSAVSSEAPRALSLCIADLDADGREDLAIGAPHGFPDPATEGERGSGAVLLYLGARSGLKAWKILGQASLGKDEPGDLFGTSVEAGDIDADGKLELVVGAPGEAPGNGPRCGVVFVFLGGKAHRGLDSLDQSGMGSNERGDLFGSTLATGDFNGDGKHDLAVSAHGENRRESTDGGALFVLYGAVDDPVPLKSFGPSDFGRDEEDVDRFGRDLVVGDFDQDGLDDLVIFAAGRHGADESPSDAAFVLRGDPNEPRNWAILKRGAPSRPSQALLDCMVRASDLFTSALAGRPYKSALGELEGELLDVGAPRRVFDGIGRTLEDARRIAVDLEQGSKRGLILITPGAHVVCAAYSLRDEFDPESDDGRSMGKVIVFSGTKEGSRKAPINRLTLRFGHMYRGTNLGKLPETVDGEAPSRFEMLKTDGDVVSSGVTKNEIDDFRAEVSLDGCTRAEWSYFRRCRYALYPGSSVSGSGTILSFTIAEQGGEYTTEDSWWHLDEWD